MHYLIVSFTHKNSTLEIREKLAYNTDHERGACLNALHECPSINEVVLIATCNRTEVICSCSSISDASEHIFKQLSKRADISIEELEGRADIFDDQGAIHHLFSVASSLDSLVIGETQIVGQIRDAYRYAYDNGFCGKKISHAMRRAFRCAAEVRTATDISSKPVSIASVAVQKAKAEMENFNNAKALIIGSGEMSRLGAQYLRAQGLEVKIINRTRHKAEALALECDTQVDDFENLPRLINEYDLIFTATGAPFPIIEDTIVEEKAFERYWFDLAVPRDIELKKAYDTIKLFQVDDLKTIVSDNMTLREEEAKTSYAIVGRHTIEFFKWLQTRSVEPMIKKIYDRAYEAAKIESCRAVEKGYIPKEYHDNARKMSQQALKLFLHELTTKMRSIEDSTVSETMLETLKYLLGEDEEQSSLKSRFHCDQKGTK